MSSTKRAGFTLRIVISQRSNKCSVMVHEILYFGNVNKSVFELVQNGIGNYCHFDGFALQCDDKLSSDMLHVLD